MLAGIMIPAHGALETPSRQVPAASGGIGIRLVSLQDNSSGPRASSYIVNRLAPGTSIRRQVEIINSTRSPANVAVYPAAAGLRKGSFGFAAGHSRNELTSWTSVGRRLLRLPAGTQALDTVTIRVPKQASSGERYAVIWAEVAAPARVEGGVTLVNRVGVRMYLSIGPGGAPPVNFTIGRLTGGRSTTGAPQVVATIHNNGRSTIDIGGSLWLSGGPGGLSAGPFSVQLVAGLAPGRSSALTVRLDPRFPRGPWRALIKLSSGFVERTLRAPITLPG